MGTCYTKYVVLRINGQFLTLPSLTDFSFTLSTVINFHCSTLSSSLLSNSEDTMSIISFLI